MPENTLTDTLAYIVEEVLIYKYIGKEREKLSNRRQRRAVRKKSPHSLPATMQDVERAKRVATDETMDMVITIVLSALLNGGFLDKDQIPDVWKSIDYLSDSITKGYVTVADLRRALRDEEEISVK